MEAARFLMRATVVVTACLLVAPEAGAQTPLLASTPAPVSNVVVSEHPDVPTVLVVTWDQDVAVAGGWLEFSIDGGPWKASPERRLAAGPARELVLGAYAEAVVEVRIMNRLLGAVGIGASSAGGGQTSGSLAHVVSSAQTWAATTGSLTNFVEEPIVSVFDAAQADPGKYVMVSFNIGDTRASLIILDRNGRIVWFRTPPQQQTMLVPRVARSGDHLVYDVDYFWGGGPGTSTIERVTIENEVFEAIEVPNLHHGWDELDDETIIWGWNPSGFNGEQLWAKDAQGTTWTVWDSDDWPVPGSVAGNAVTAEGNDTTALMSFWTNDSAIEVDLDTGAILRQFGAVPGSWSFNPPSSQFWFAHAVNYTEAGTLLLSSHFQPGFNPPIKEQRIYEYALNDQLQRLDLVWSYGAGETDFYAPTWGQAIRLDNGNTLINTGSNPHVREVTPSGDIVWSLSWIAGGGGLADRLLGDMTMFGDLADLYALKGPGR